MSLDLKKRLENKRYFDEKKTPLDVWAVAKMSALLGISEFRLFEIAYRKWYGRDGDEQLIERYFVPFMFDDQVPLWVRHFTNLIERLDNDGTLNPSDFGIRNPDATAQQIRQGGRYALIIVTVMTALILLAEASANLMGLSHCFFPPCY